MQRLSESLSLSENGKNTALELEGVSFSLFPRYNVLQEVPGSCLGTRQGAFDPKSLVLAEHCLLGQPESCQGKQGFVTGFHWYEKQMMQFLPSLR